MSMKKGTYVSLILLILMAIGYFYLADTYKNFEDGGSIGPGYFPKICAVILIILCIISMFKTKKQKDKKIELPNLSLVFVTIGIIIAYLLCWYYLGLFYVNTFLFIIILLTIYGIKAQMKLKKMIYINIAVTICLVFVIYFLFERLLNISF